jgi:hypothetical protein
MRRRSKGYADGRHTAGFRVAVRYITRLHASGERGSITVEASIIVPLVILSISAALYIGMLLYQKALLQSAAEAAAEAGAAVWASGTSALESYRPDRDSDNFRLYRRIYDDGGEDRLKKIEEYALSLASRGELVKSVETTADAVIRDYIVYRKLEVSICKCYNVPLGKFMKIFGGSDRVMISARAVSTVSEPAELIRTTDFIIDLEKKLEARFPGLKKVGDKTRETMNDLKARLEQFVD